MVAQHSLDAQFLDSDDAEAVDDAPRVLVAEIMAAVADALMDTRNDLAGLLPSTAPALLFCEFALCFRQCLFFLAEEARVSDELTVGECGEGFQANVNADGFLGWRQRSGPDLLAERGEPLAVDAADGAGLEFAPRPAVEFGLHLPDLGEADAAVSDLETVVLRVSDAVVLALPFKTREARSLAFGDPLEERLERQLDAVNHILQNLTVDRFEFGVAFLPGGEIRLLREVTHRGFSGAVLELPIVDEAVVDKATGFEGCFQLVRLRPVGIEPDF